MTLFKKIFAVYWCNDQNSNCWDCESPTCWVNLLVQKYPELIDLIMKDIESMVHVFNKKRFLIEELVDRISLTSKARTSFRNFFWNALSPLYTTIHMVEISEYKVSDKDTLSILQSVSAMDDIILSLGEPTNDLIFEIEELPNLFILNGTTFNTLREFRDYLLWK